MNRHRRDPVSGKPLNDPTTGRATTAWETIEANWEPMIERERWEKLQAHVNDPRRRRLTPRRRQMPTEQARREEAEAEYRLPDSGEAEPEASAQLPRRAPADLRRAASGLDLGWAEAFDRAPGL